MRAVAPKKSATARELRRSLTFGGGAQREPSNLPLRDSKKMGELG
jgi:hypothetical protein